MDTVVFVEIQGRTAFVDWAADHDISITYQFHGFSAFRITPRVADLPSLKEQSAVTGIDWRAGELGTAACE